MTSKARCENRKHVEERPLAMNQSCWLSDCCVALRLMNVAGRARVAADIDAWHFCSGQPLQTDAVVIDGRGATDSWSAAQCSSALEQLRGHLSEPRKIAARATLTGTHSIDWTQGFGCEVDKFDLGFGSFCSGEFSGNRFGRCQC